MDALISSNDIRNARRLREGENLRIPNIDGISYVVKKGDSLSRIAKSSAVPLEVILDVNNIRSEVIKEGETLFIPGARMAPEALKLALGELFIYPVRKRITSPFGWRADPFTGVRSFHAALDLGGSMGTPVKAAMDGTVSTVSVNRVYGNFIILSHAGGYQTLYAHLSGVSVKQGSRVGQGSKIGEVGNTGLSTGPHLHFGIFKNGKAVNPLDLLQ
jgi:murein DD-endopeptidase MepM/ murein hydrolase activator NlpD